MYRYLICSIVASALGMASVAPVTGQPLCRPTLTVTDAQLSEIQPLTLERKWTATVAVDAAHCQAKSSGQFEIVFTRLSETAPDLEFRERFVWAPPSVRVSVDLDRDEAVEHYRLDNVSTCVCRE
jgi:hypothetical protein